MPGNASSRAEPMSSLTLLVLSMSVSALVVAVLSSPEEAEKDKARAAMRIKAPVQLYAPGAPKDEGNECSMEVSVTQKVVGECVKLGRFVRGCVAGSYLETYHADCV